MAKVDYKLDEHVAILFMNDGENRLNPPFIEAMMDQLDKIERDTDARTLVVTSSHEKIFSNGLDLNFLGPAFKARDMKTVEDFFDRLDRFFIRLLTYPMLTIAAISGHAFAGGAILACACDFRFMRTDRGFFCLPEVDLGLPFPPGFVALLRKAIPMPIFEEMQYTGKRYTAEECRTHHIVTDACPGDVLMEKTIAYAKGLNKGREVVREMRMGLHKNIIRTLKVEDRAYIRSKEFLDHWRPCAGA